MSLHDQARAVRSREDLVAFLAAFHADLPGDEASWPNNDLESFLEAMAAWANDMAGSYEHNGEDMASLSPWRIMADIMMAARIYE